MFISSNLSLYEKQILELYSINNIYIESFKKIMLAKNVKGIIMLIPNHLRILFEYKIKPIKNFSLLQDNIFTFNFN